MLFRSVGFAVVTIVFVLLAGVTSGFAQTTQQHVHEMSHDVMPFDMSKTLHIFRMTEFGGIEQIVVRDPDYRDQIALIRQHLKHEAIKFQHGDYADPIRLHGANMPGVHELAQNASQINVSYEELPNGAQLVFKTKGVRLLTAVHRWFGAQLSEHGADARAE